MGWQSVLVLASRDMYYLLALCFLGVVSGRQPAAPQHSADHLPDTQFSCRDKVLGGYYADPDAQCQMFHVCVKVAGVGIQDFRFLCPNGTAFDQEAQICAGWADVACEPAALYYSSDNFDLYRIGSGFESKKAPLTFEEEPDFHLQRSEPDILSGAHSSNFFNGKDNQDVAEKSGKAKNQFDQPQKKKVVRKLQRRPVESSPQPSPTPARQFTNNFAGSYVPTTARTTTTTTVRPSSQAQQYNDNYNNHNARGNNYQSIRQPSTAAPNDYYKSTQDNQYSTKSDQFTPQNKPSGRNFKSRTQSTPDYSYNTEADQFKNKQTTSANVNYNVGNQQSNNQQINNQQINNQQNNNQQNNNQQNNKQQKYYDNQNYNGEQFNQQSTPKYNFIKERRQKSETPQPTTKVTYNSGSSTQYDNRQSSPQYNTNNNNDYNRQNVNYNQQTTPKYNYNSNSDQKQNNYQETSNYNTKTSQPSTPQYNQQYNNNQQSTQLYNSENTQFDKIKSTTKFAEKKQQFNTNKQSNQYNYNDQQNNNQQTPAPKFNTNLQYDNNQQSTPHYNNYNSENNQQYKNYQSTSTSIAPQQFSTAAPTYNSRGTNNNQRSSTNEYQQYSTNHQPSSTTYNNNQGFEQKSTAVFQQYSTVRPTNNVNYQQKSTPAPFKSDKPEDYDDGQYHPELYEREAGGEYDITARHNLRNESPSQRTPEPELLKAAHSINIAASGNQLLRENRPQVPVVSTTFAPVQKPTRGTTAQAARSVYTSPTPKNVYSSVPAVTSAAPRPFTARPTQLTTLAPVHKPVQTKQPSNDFKQSSHSSAAKPVSSSKVKDVSYDYAYYDNSDHYSEYENIEEFRRTSKKQ